MEELLIQIAIVTDMENIIYPENQPGGPDTWGKVTANKLIGIYLATNNNFKSIIGKDVFYKIFFLLNLVLLLGLLKTQAQQNDNYAIDANIIYRFSKYINWPDDKKSGDFIIVYILQYKN
jgi:hypothetical protein